MTELKIVPSSSNSAWVWLNVVYPIHKPIHKKYSRVKRIVQNWFHYYVDKLSNGFFSISLELSMKVVLLLIIEKLLNQSFFIR